MSVDENNRAVSVNLGRSTRALQHSLLPVKGNIIILLCINYSMNVRERIQYENQLIVIQYKTCYTKNDDIDECYYYCHW